jgi:hypothetical protein
MPWRYKFLVTERSSSGEWYAVSEDERSIEPRRVEHYLDGLLRQGWVYVVIVPRGSIEPAELAMLTHVLKKWLE